MAPPPLHAKPGQENDALASNSRPTTPFDETPKVNSPCPPEGSSAPVQDRRSRIGLNMDGSAPTPPPEDADARMAREMAESEELARTLMAEEAMASYALGADYLRANADQFSGEDLAALQAAMMEEDPDGEDLVDDQVEGEESAELSYETMLNLGERIGDVKQERWKMRAAAVIATLPLMTFAKAELDAMTDADDSALKCLVCQCEYEEGEQQRGLPCGHVFHQECADEWLGRKDVCPYCSTCIEKEKV